MLSAFLPRWALSEMSKRSSQPDKPIQYSVNICLTINFKISVGHKHTHKNANNIVKIYSKRTKVSSKALRQKEIIYVWLMFDPNSKSSDTLFGSSAKHIVRPGAKNTYIYIISKWQNLKPFFTFSSISSKSCWIWMTTPFPLRQNKKEIGFGTMRQPNLSHLRCIGHTFA